MANIRPIFRFVFSIRTRDMDAQTGLDVEESVEADYFKVAESGDLTFHNAIDGVHHIVMAYARGEWKRVSRPVVRVTEVKATAEELEEIFKAKNLRPVVDFAGFMECDTCRAKPGTPILCAGCSHNRTRIHNLIAEDNPPDQQEVRTVERTR